MPRICGPENKPLEPKPPPEEGAADEDVLGGDAEQAGDALLRHGHALARGVDGELVAVPCGDDGVRLHRVMVLGGGVVGGFDADGGGGEAGGGVPAVLARGLAGADGGGLEALLGVEAGARRFRLVFGGEQGGAFGGGFQRVGDDDGDRLVGVADRAVLQHVDAEHEGVELGVRVHRERRLVVGGHHVDHAGMRLGGGDIERRDPAAGDAADRHDGVGHALGVGVGGVAGGAGDFQDAFTPGQGLADAGAHADVGGGLGLGRLRHGGLLLEPGRRGRRGGLACGLACRRRPWRGRGRRCGGRARS